MISLLLILPILSTLATLFLGLFVFLNNPKNKINQTFSLFTFWGAFWIFSVFMADYSKNLSDALFWTRMSVVGPAIFSPILFYFSRIFPFESIKIKFIKIKFWKIILLFSPALIFLVLSPTKINIEKVWFEAWGTNFQPGFLYYLLILYIILYFGLAFRNFFKSHKEVSGIEKLQIRYIFLGFFLSVIIGLTTNAILPLFGYAQLSSIGPTFSFISLGGFTALAITKYHLFEIRVILTEILVGAMGILLLVFSFLLPESYKFLGLGIFFLFLIFAYYLIKTTHQEERRREEAEKLAVRERGLREEVEKVVIREKAIREKMEKFARLKTEFLAMSSHQLKTPSTHIKNFVDLILRSGYGEVPENLKDPLNKVLISNERLIRIVNQILVATNLELGILKPVPQNVLLEKDILKPLIKEFQPAIQEKNLYLRVKNPEAKTQIFIDLTFIKEAISNLIDNGLKYTPKGGIEISASQKENSILIAIRDTGMGINKEDLLVLFESFGKGRAGYLHWMQGTGLGLYIAKKFVQANNGKIWAESEGEGKGSTFYIELPIK